MLLSNLEKLRISNGWTQEEIAKKIGVARTTYTNYEAGKREPDIETAQKIADVCGVSVDYLLGKTNVTSEEAKELEGAPEAARPIIRSLARAKELDEEDFDIIAKQVEDIIAYAKKKKQISKND
ncbi:helix-turn-helix transcriptional regulator [Paenibacillus sp. 32352]|uniref:helix-turn-helix transcriptional regulator n=1 Tax=Paenibacillus sp. 32352 TaxID=1969111 RepID=UPI0009AF097F|nr:helix-turn-helix transcriptional regulator [Paenibacillus sp. 32352]